jgi:hypothetical protein
MYYETEEEARRVAEKIERSQGATAHEMFVRDDSASDVPPALGHMPPAHEWFHAAHDAAIEYLRMIGGTEITKEDGSRAFTTAHPSDAAAYGATYADALAVAYTKRSQPVPPDDPLEAAARAL